MKWEEDNIKQHIEYINAELLKGRTMADIEQLDFGVNKKTITRRLERRGYKRSSDGNKLFVLIDSNKANVKPIKAKNDGVKAKAKVNNKSIDRLSDEEIKQLRELLEIREKLVDIVSNTKDTQHIDNINIIQSKETKQRMFRIDVEVLERWNKFCADHKHLKVSSLISSALDLFMNTFEE